MACLRSCCGSKLGVQLLPMMFSNMLLRAVLALLCVVLAHFLGSHAIA